jgi:hypothetical protein
MNFGWEQRIRNLGSNSDSPWGLYRRICSRNCCRNCLWALWADNPDGVERDEFQEVEIGDGEMETKEGGWSWDEEKGGELYVTRSAPQFFRCTDRFI